MECAEGWDDGKCATWPPKLLTAITALAGIMGSYPGFPNAETLNLTMSYVDVGLIGHRVQTRKGPV